MCRSNMESGRRCPCDTNENRRKRRRNQLARTRGQELGKHGSTLHRPSPPVHGHQLDTPATIEQVQESVEKTRALTQEWDDVSRSQGKNSPSAKKIMKKLVRSTIVTGALINSRVEQETGCTDAEYAAQWEQETQTLTSQLTEAQEAAQRLPEGDEREEYIAQHVTPLKKRLAEREGDAGTELLDYTSARGDKILGVLSQVRSMGQESFSSVNPENSHAHLSQKYFPSSWVTRANETRNPLVYLTENNASFGGFYRDDAPTQDVRSRLDENDVNPDSDRISYVVANKLYVDAYSAHQGASELSDEQAREQKKNKGVEKLSGHLLRTAYLHELTHRVENMGGDGNADTITESERAFFMRRTTTDGVRDTPEKVKTASGDITLYPDSFADAYTGRDYGTSSKSLEILTTGIESVLSGARGGLMGVGGYKADPEHKHYVLGLWASY